MTSIAIILLSIGIIAGICFLQLLFSEYCLARDREAMAERIMAYSDESIRHLPQFRKILVDLDDVLARSLPPEEYESDELLERMDKEKKQMQADHIYLIAFLSEHYDRFLEQGIEFRCKLGMPALFEEESYLDLLVLYDYLLEAGQEAAAYEMARRSAETMPEGSGMSPVRTEMIRIRESSQFGLWHLHMDVTISDAQWQTAGRRFFPAMYKHPWFRRKKRVARRLLNKYRLKWRNKYTGNRFEIDIIT